jgi:Family of unknown function (DUF6455)
MIAQHETYPTVEFLIDRFAGWLKHRRELNELRRMNRTDFDAIARDLRVTPDDLDQLVQAGPHGADELPDMLEALGIDGESLARTDPLMVRDMQRVCAMCRDKAQCDADLAGGTAAEHYKSYCSNASTLESLSGSA